MLRIHSDILEVYAAETPALTCNPYKFQHEGVRLGQHPIHSGLNWANWNSYGSCFFSALQAISLFEYLEYSGNQQ